MYVLRVDLRPLRGVRDALRGRVFQGSGGQVTYHLAECIGEGGQGWVFRAHWDEPTGQPVIVKVLRPDVVNADVLARFQREASVLRMLAMQGNPNPYVVRFFDHAIAQVALGTQEPPTIMALPFTVLEYVHGPTLEEIMKTDGARGLAPARARRLLRHVAHALEHVHAQRVVHRDLKPSNILIATDGGTEIAKVTDFGLAKMVDVNMHRTATLAGASLGYAPPEQYERGNARVGVRTDVFSLAAILFEMLTGRLAFPYRSGENPLLIVSRVLTAPRPSLMNDLGADLPHDLRRMPEALASIDGELKRALDADPTKRHSGVNEFLRAVDAQLQAFAGGSVPPRVTPASQHPPTQPHPPSQDARSVAPPQAQGQVQAQAQGAPQSRYGANPSQAAGAAPAPGEGTLMDSNRVRFRAVCDPRPGELFRAGSIDARGAAFAVTTTGAERMDDAFWRPVTLNLAPMSVPPGAPPPFDLVRVRGVTSAAQAQFVYGDGFALRFDGQQAVLMHMPLPGIVYQGASVTAARTLLVGERRARDGVFGFVCEYAGAEVVSYADVRETARVNDAACVNGEWIVCGDDGFVARLVQGRVADARAVCRGHLLSMTVTGPRELVAVGTGGHALALTPALEPRLEAVETTRDLRRVVSADGAAWAVSREGRLLYRTASGGGIWRRVAFPSTDSTRVLALWASARDVRVLCADGAVFAGTV